MTNKSLSQVYVLFALICLFTIGCQDLKVNEPLDFKENKPISIEEAKKIINSKGLNGKNPIWELAQRVTRNNVTFLDIPVTVDFNLTPAIPDKSGIVNEEIIRFTQSELTHLFVYEDKNGIIQTEVLTYIPDDSFYENLKKLGI